MLAIVQKVADNLKKSQEVKFELNQETIDQIGAIVLQIVAMFKQCKQTPEGATTVVNSPNVVQKARVRAAVRKELGFWKNRKDGTEYVDAILKAGYSATVSDVKEAFGVAA